MTTHKTSEAFPNFSKLKGSPCNKCLIKMSCTKSFIRRTACDPYKSFVKKLIDKAITEYKKETNENKT